MAVSKSDANGQIWIEFANFINPLNNGPFNSKQMLCFAVLL